MEKEKLVCAECGSDELTFSGTKIYTTDDEEDFGDDIWFCQNCHEPSDFITEKQYAIIEEVETLIKQWYLIPKDCCDCREFVIDSLYQSSDPKEITLWYGRKYDLTAFL